MTQASSFFVVIEGLDGSGKTHLSRALKRVLQKTHEQDVELTFEPHDPSSAGLYIRQVLTKRIKNVRSRTLALAYALNRADHNDRVIQPFLDASQQRIMICDRYYLSSLVYQSSADVSFDEIMLLNKDARKPDLTLFLSVSADTGYARMSKRPASKELFDDNLEASRRKYHEAIAYLRARGDMIVELDANGTIDEVLKAVLDVLQAHGPNWLRIERPLFDSTLDEFLLQKTDEAEAAITAWVKRFCKRWSAVAVSERQILNDIKAALEAEVERFSDNELGLMFIGYLQRWGYTVVDRLPWTELYAYELSYEMPLGVKLWGTALLLTDTHHFDQATKKIQLILDPTNPDTDVNRLSNFMFVLDSVPRVPSVTHYESDAGTGKMSPSVRRMQRQDIAALLYADVLRMYASEIDLPHLQETISEIMRTYQPEAP
jgi:dTMP kinase